MKEIHNFLEYMDLSPEVTKSEIERVCKDAIDNNVYSVCVNPFYVKMVNRLLSESSVKTSTVISYPYGQTTTKSKVFEAHDAIKNGADEIEMVLNTSRLKAGDVDFCVDEINAVKRVCKKRSLKVIIDWNVLTLEEIQLACQIVITSKADFISLGVNHKKIPNDKVKVVCELIKSEKGIKVLSPCSEKDITNMLSLGVTRVGIDDKVKK